MTREQLYGRLTKIHIPDCYEIVAEQLRCFCLDDKDTSFLYFEFHDEFLLMKHLLRRLDVLFLPFALSPCFPSSFKYGLEIIMTRK